MDDASILSLLNEAGERCFTCGSVRFAMVAELRDGVFYWLVYFQNHDVRDAALTLLVLARSADSLQLQSTIDCPGGQLGLRRIHWPVPHDYANETHRCLIYGDLSHAGTTSPHTTNRPPSGIPVLPMADAARLTMTGRNLSFEAFQGWVAALDADFARGASHLLIPDESEEERLSPVFQ